MEAIKIIIIPLIMFAAVFGWYCLCEWMAQYIKWFANCNSENWKKAFYKGKNNRKRNRPCQATERSRLDMKIQERSG